VDVSFGYFNVKLTKETKGVHLKDIVKLLAHATIVKE
jgi:hypothetical protein